MKRQEIAESAWSVISFPMYLADKGILPIISFIKESSFLRTHFLTCWTRDEITLEISPAAFPKVSSFPSATFAVIPPAVASNPIASVSVPAEVSNKLELLPPSCWILKSCPSALEVWSILTVAFVVGWYMQIDELEVVKELLWVVFAGYFGGRTYEKVKGKSNG